MKGWWKANHTLAFHYGYYEKGFRSHDQAILHMNDVVWDMLGLDGTRPLQILDAGCGVGGTSIYLAKKYPMVSFTGISIAPSEIQFATELAVQNKVTENTRFLQNNFCDIKFPDGSFDGVIALESINYASDTRELFQEMYRILKPGGRLVVLDGFRTQKRLSPMMQKAYHHWLSGRAIDDLVSINDCVMLMAEQKFQQITATDISSRTAASELRGVVIGLPFFFSILVKSIVSLNRYKRSDDNFYMGVSFCGGLLAVSGRSKYYAVTAIK
ncbi:MAG: class I SAM-dependent methyltransferase [Thermoplasmata archaeon]|nr:class I SAM-dependent methyltransferase [Thermoplasmata archaeon]